MRRIGGLGRRGFLRCTPDTVGGGPPRQRRILEAELAAASKAKPTLKSQGKMTKSGLEQKIMSLEKELKLKDEIIAEKNKLLETKDEYIELLKKQLICRS